MSHFLLKKDHAPHRTMERHYVAIRVRVVSKRPRVLQMDPDIGAGLCIIKAGTKVARLPDDVEVRGPGGTVLPRGEAKLYTTVETIDPYHLLLDDHSGLAFKAA